MVGYWTCLSCNFTILDGDMMKCILYVKKLNDFLFATTYGNILIWKSWCVINVSFGNVAIEMIKCFMIYEVWQSDWIKFVWGKSWRQFMIRLMFEQKCRLGIICSRMFMYKLWWAKCLKREWCKGRILLCENVFSKQTFKDEMVWMTDVQICYEEKNEGWWMIFINQAIVLSQPEMVKRTDGGTNRRRSKGLLELKERYTQLFVRWHLILLSWYMSSRIRCRLTKICLCLWSKCHWRVNMCVKSFNYSNAFVFWFYHCNIAFRLLYSFCQQNKLIG